MSERQRGVINFYQMINLTTTRTILPSLYGPNTRLYIVVQWKGKVFLWLNLFSSLILLAFFRWMVVVVVVIRVKKRERVMNKNRRRDERKVKFVLFSFYCCCQRRSQCRWVSLLVWRRSVKKEIKILVGYFFLLN